MNKIHPGLLSLAVPVDLIDHLPGNPHQGDVNAVAAMLDEFGQLKCIVLRSNGDRFICIAGNTTLKAARDVLGWTEIAGVTEDMDPIRAMMFAIGDNRSAQLGEDDPVLLQEAMDSIVDDYDDMLEVLQWDEFERAALSEQADDISIEQERGYTPPVLQPRPETARKSEPSHMDAPGDIDIKDTIARGAQQEKSRAVVQYTLVFDNPDQQRRWYDFLKWLRSDPGIDGETVSEKLIMFLEGHAEF